MGNFFLVLFLCFFQGSACLCGMKSQICFWNKYVGVLWLIPTWVCINYVWVQVFHNLFEMFLLFLLGKCNILQIILIKFEGFWALAKCVGIDLRYVMFSDGTIWGLLRSLDVRMFIVIHGWWISLTI